MKKITVGLTIFIFFCQHLFSWGETWLRVYNELGAGKTGNSICQTNNGDFLFVGSGLYAIVKINSFWVLHFSML